MSYVPLYGLAIVKHSTALKHFQVVKTTTEKVPEFTAFVRYVELEILLLKWNVSKESVATSALL